MKNEKITGNRVFLYGMKQALMKDKSNYLSDKITTRPSGSFYIQLSKMYAKSIINVLSLLALITITACTHTITGETDTIAENRWVVYDSISKEYSESNLDSMYKYSSRLYSEAVLNGNNLWKAKALLLLGYYNSLKGDSDTSKFLIQKGIDLARLIDDSTTMEQGYSHLGSLYLGTGSYKEAAEAYRTGLKFVEKSKDTSKIVKYYNNLGNAAEKSDDLVKAQDYMNKALSMAEKIKDTMTMASSIRNLSYILKKSGDNESALQHLRKSLYLFTQISDNRWIARLYTDLGIYFRYLNPDSAYLYYNKGLGIYTSLGEECTITITRFNMANLLFDKQQYVDAEKEFLNIYNICEKENNTLGQAYSSIMLASTYEKLKDFSRADLFIRKSEALANQLKMAELKQNINITRIKISKAQGNYREALGYYERYDEMKDSLNSIEKKSNILELQKKFDIEKKELLIASLRQKTTIQAQKLRNRSLVIISLSAFLTLIMLSLLFIVIYYRKSTAANLKLRLQSEVLRSEIQQREIAQQHLFTSEQQLRTMNAQKDKFFSIIAHDLKSPFNAIIGLSRILLEQVREKDLESIETYTLIIQESSVRAMDLLTNLMDWARSQTGRMKFNPVDFEIKLLVEEIVSLFDETARQKSIVMTNQMPDGIHAFGDKAMIHTIFRNLVSNAIKFTKPGGLILITMELKSDELVFSVKDNGLGIPGTRIEKLFRVDEGYSTSGTNQEKGTGLGLILCKEFVEKHGGRIWVESEEGFGSKFSFGMPLKQTV